MASSLPKVHSTPQGPSRNLACGKLEWIIYQGGIRLSTGDVREARRDRTKKDLRKSTLRRSSQNVEDVVRRTEPGLRHPEC